jgi:glyoxylase-like metal-dependent hydrolase (beta-lactamase superfamily II)
VDDAATIEVGGRSLELRHLGRGHTDNDLVIVAADARVLFAGDLITKSEFPFFGDAWPIDFPATIRGVGELTWGTIVTGHGGLGDRDYYAYHLDRLDALKSAAERAHAAGVPWKDVVDEVPLPKGSASDGLRRAYAQLDGQI